MEHTRVVRLSLSPPRRLLALNRWRTFKVGPDRQVWADCMAPVNALIDAGLDITKVHIEWGRSQPFGVEHEVRVLTMCAPDECELTQSYGKPGKGYTAFTLERP